MYKPTTQVGLFLRKILLLAGVTLLSVYFLYRITFINFSPFIVVFSLILFLAELHTIFHLYGMFYSIWPRKYKEYNQIYKNKDLRINMFICVCGEPVEVVRETVLAAKNAASNYSEIINPNYKPQVIVLNDGKVAGKDNWQEIAALADELGVTHFEREVPGGFKAGNINNGLANTPTKDPHNTLDIVLDADFSAKKEFLIELTKPFVDETIDFAQSPQRYKNEKTWVAKAAAAHQIFFFDNICASKGHDNALFLCGTNFAIRRSALESIGGIDTRFITEDYATSLELHLAGKKGVFIPKVLAEGIAPSSLKQYFSQQQRWGKGSFDVTRSYLFKILFGGMTFRQKFHYSLSASYYLIGVRDLILMLAPLPYLFFGVSLIRSNTWQFLLFVYGPLFVYNFTLYLVLFKHPIKSLVLDIASFPVFVSAFLSSLIKKDLSFIVTIKKYEKENPLGVYKMQLLVTAILLTGLYFGLRHPVGNGGAILNYFWAVFDVSILSFGFYLIIRENFNTSSVEEVYFAVSGFLAMVFRLPMQVLPRAVYMVILVIVGGYIVANLNFVPAKASFNIVRQAVVQAILPIPVEELLVPTNGVYYGYYQAELNSHPSNPIVTKVAGEKTSLAMFYQDWAGKTLFDANFATKLASDGVVPIITWEPRDSTNLANANEFNLNSIVAGTHDDFIHSWAKVAADYKQPFFLRFAHEMNGSWYDWGNRNSPETYIAAWRHVHDIFQSEKATNVIWVWSPNNTDEKGISESLLSFYPGDNYVDWVGYSGFNWGTLGTGNSWKTFKEISTTAYEKLSTLNKPIMVTETSSVSKGGDKVDWFEQTLKEDIPSFPKIKAVVFFDENFLRADFSLDLNQDYAKVVADAIANNGYYLKDPILKTK